MKVVLNYIFVQKFLIFLVKRLYLFLDAAAASHDVLEAEVKRISGVYASFFKDKKKKKRDERDDLLLP